MPTLDTTAPEAMPPENTVSPADEIVTPLATPPEYTVAAPLITTVPPVSTPPDMTIADSPLTTVAPESVPVVPLISDPKDKNATPDPSRSRLPAAKLPPITSPPGSFVMRTARGDIRVHRAAAGRNEFDPARSYARGRSDAARRDDQLATRRDCGPLARCRSCKQTVATPPPVTLPSASVPPDMMIAESPLPTVAPVSAPVAALITDPEDSSATPDWLSSRPPAITLPPVAAPPGTTIRAPPEATGTLAALPPADTKTSPPDWGRSLPRPRHR